jgi:phosphatidylglycerol:prolipoprotein diacylglycerol transferase
VHPILFHSGHVAIPSYGALAAVGLMLALTLSLRTSARVGLDPDTVWDAGLFALLAAFCLSRLLLIATNLHSFLQYPMLMIAVPSLTPLGLLLTGIATGVWMWMHRLPWLATLDAWAPCATLVWAFVALGHFAEGSDLGLPTSRMWGVRLPGDSTPTYPVAVYAALLAAGLTLALLLQLERRRAQGDTFCLALGAVGVVQFLLSFLREPSFEMAETSLDPLQWVSVGMIAAAGLVYVQRRVEVGRST